VGPNRALFASGLDDSSVYPDLMGRPYLPALAPFFAVSRFLPRRT